MAVFFAAAGAIWHSMAGSIELGVAAGAALALPPFASAFFSATDNLFAIRYAKGQKLKHEDFVQWNSFSRIAVRDYMILIDADASTGIASFNFERLSARDRHLLLEDGPALPYALRPGAKTLVIGPGGGWDIARALASGSHDITGVEINPIIATTVMRQRFRAAQPRHLLAPRRAYFYRGRPQLRASQSRKKYQVLQATLVDTWAIHPRPAPFRSPRKAISTLPTPCVITFCT